MAGRESSLSLREARGAAAGQVRAPAGTEEGQRLGATLSSKPGAPDGLPAGQASTVGC